MIPIRSALARPFTDIRRLIGGILVSSIPIIHLTSLGYFLRCATQTTEKLPAWNQPIYLWMQGLQASIIIAIYHIPVAILFFVLSRFALPTALGIMMAVINIVTLAATWYTFPAALTNFAQNGWRAAFSPVQLRRTIVSNIYAKYWVCGMIIVTVGTYGGGLLAQLPPTLWILRLLILGSSFFIVGVIFWTLIGSAREYGR